MCIPILARDPSVDGSLQLGSWVGEGGSHTGNVASNRLGWSQ